MDSPEESGGNPKIGGDSPLGVEHPMEMGHLL